MLFRSRLEAGSYDSLNASVSAMGFRAGYFETKGFSAADAREGNSEKDGSQAWNLGGSKDFPLNNSILMRLNAQYQNSKTDTDRSGGLHGDSRNTYATHSQFFLREENVILIPEDAEISLSGSYSNHDREDNTNGNDYYKANQWKVETIGRQKNIGPHSLDRKSTRLNSSHT